MNSFKSAIPMIAILLFSTAQLHAQCGSGFNYQPIQSTYNCSVGTSFPVSMASTQCSQPTPMFTGNVVQPSFQPMISDYSPVMNSPAPTYPVSTNYNPVFNSPQPVANFSPAPVYSAPFSSAPASFAAPTFNGGFSLRAPTCSGGNCRLPF